MVIETSALVAVQLEEPGFEDYLSVMAKAAHRCMSACSFYEASVVIAGLRGTTAAKQLRTLVADLMIDIVPFDAHQAELARDAYFRFGKGYHPAGLNLADCMAYALAKRLGEPLLFKGNDFSRTDVLRA